MTQCWQKALPGIDRNAFNAELMGVILAIENAHMRGWNNLIIECDSMLAVFHLCN